MKFKVTKSSDWHYEKQIEINTLEELMSFIDENGKIVLTPPLPEVVDRQRQFGLPRIEIYDTWRE